jgi:hypothetical protein
MLITTGADVPDEYENLQHDIFIDRILERYESHNYWDNYLDDLDSLENITETNEDFKNEKDCNQ